MGVRPIEVLALLGMLAASCGGSDRTAVDTAPPTGDAVPAVTEPAVTEPAATQPVATEPAVTEPAATEPVATEPAVTEPAATDAASTVPPGEPADVACAPVTVETGGTAVPGERCDPGGAFPPPRPAAIVLNGCGGYESDTEITGATVRALAERGVIALRLDYLAAAPAPPDTYCDAGAVIGAVQPLLGAIVDGIATLRADPGADPARVGTAAYSLGALAAMAVELGGAGLTDVPPADFSAAALLSYPDLLPAIPAAARDGALPPLYLMTGEDDIVAPPAGAQSLAAAAAEGGTPVELVLVPGQEHPWRGAAAIAAAAAIGDSLATLLGA